MPRVCLAVQDRHHRGFELQTSTRPGLRPNHLVLELEFHETPADRDGFVLFGSVVESIDQGEKIAGPAIFCRMTRSYPRMQRHASEYFQT